ncbi:hypothetical protein A3F37_01015 [Candidatus Saccharibacteria bacterium RIFCSPHIGHO2_12_FULL_41_12]|nr:MAG: hypothetical protein A3F37_01015 [Candidatus Saccharibacteria bacterium RIFCSPHIGHO2_12_FULL_41_12]
MKVQSKIFGIVCFVFLVAAVATWVATITLVQSKYVAIEANNTKQDTSRGVDALNNEVNQLAQKTPDWSSWDDTYKFIKDRNNAYIISNVQSASLQNLKINFVLFYDDNQRLVFSAGINTENGENIPLPQELSKAFAPNSSLLAKTKDEEHSGLINTSAYPLIISSSPILRSDESGPVRGTLVFARYLKQENVAKLGELTHLNLKFDPAIDASGAKTPEADNTSDDSARIQTTGNQLISGYQVINDIYGKPLLVAHVEAPRSIFQQAQHTLFFYMLVILGVFLSTILIVMYTVGRIMQQGRLINTEQSSKKEIEKQVIERTLEITEEKARLSSAIDGLNVGLLMTFNDRDNISYNPALINILGLRDTALSSRKVGASVTLAQIQQKLQQIKKHNLNEAIATCQKDGKPFEIKEATYGNHILSIFGAPVIAKLDKIIGTVVLIEEITEQKVMERSKDEFFSIASHELRTPLTAIKGNSSMIMDYYKEILKDDTLKEMVADVHESSVRLIDIVNDFLDISRLEQGKVSYDYEAVNLQEVIEKVAYEMKEEMANRHLQITVEKLTLDTLPKVWADKNRLKQVVYNLVGNATKFTEKGGITIRAEANDKFVKIFVEDTGHGMSSESQQLLFHKFQQAGDSLITRDTTRGTGLGLYISKMIVENMGGNIALEKSEEGVGSTFSFSIPVATTKIKEKPKKKVVKTKTDSTTGMSEKKK